MDAATLSALIDASSAELAALHAQLGSPPAELEKAMAALKTCIHDAVHAQLRLVQADVTRVAEQCTQYEKNITALCAATGAKREGEKGDAPLLAQEAHLKDEQGRLEKAYDAQKQQCAVVLEQIRTLDACMSDAGGKVPDPDVAHGEWQDVSAQYLQRLESHWQHVQQVYTARKVQMEAQLTEIVQLWSDLHVMPKVTVLGRQISADASEQAQFHLAILRYIQQVPSLDDGTFHGEFVPLEQGDTSLLAAEVTALNVDDTPAPTHPLLQPTDGVMAQSEALRTSLEQEKTQRETNIQTYYDELCELWGRFGVPDDEMDAFVHEHCGSTLGVVAAYKEELDKMRALKSQHMSLFIAKTREQIWDQWDALYMSEEERQSLFPAYFLELPSDDAPATDFDWDAILAQHEQMCTRLGEMLEQRAPLLAKIGEYRRICDEAIQLENSSHDAARLLGRGNRGDPGRLLREEKMRKRVKIQKPRIEQELLGLIPQWEEENDMPFLMDGRRYVEYLQEQLEAAKENAKHVRTRAPVRDAKPAPAYGQKRPAPASRPVSRAAPRVAAPPPRPASRAAPTPRPRVGARVAYAETPRTTAPYAETPQTGCASDETTLETPLHRQRTPSTLLASSFAQPTPSGRHW